MEAKTIVVGDRLEPSSTSCLDGRQIPHLVFRPHGSSRHADEAMRPLFNVVEDYRRYVCGRGPEGGWSRSSMRVRDPSYFTTSEVDVCAGPRS
jgi:hypothetical protein